MTRRSRLIVFLVWSVLALIGFLAITAAARQEIERQTTATGERLAIIAATQSRAVSAWLTQKRDAVASLAENVSLKLYLSQLSLGTATVAGQEPAEVTFLRNLVIATAANNGFGSVDEPAIRANVPSEPGAGIRLTGPDGAIIVTTRNMPQDELLPSEVNAEPRAVAKIGGPFSLGTSGTAVAFRQPVTSLQADAGTPPIGQLTATALFDARFYQLLSPPAGDSQATSVLIARDGDGFDAYTAETSIKVPGADGVAKAAIASPGQLVQADGTDGKSDFAVASAVEGATGWWVLRRTDRSAALAGATVRARWWVISYLLAVCLVSAAVIAFWRNQSAVRNKEAARHYRALAHRIEQQERMLTLIAETTPTATYIVDESEHFRYANRRAAEQFRMDRATLQGKPVAEVLGAARAESLNQINRRALDTHSPQRSDEVEGDAGMPLRSIAREHIPLEAIPFSAGLDERSRSGVLVLETDVTPLVQSREREKRTLSQLIATLVSLVDRRDPHAAHHSTCVALVAHGIAETMQLESPLPETARIAGQLVNLGKILVPEALLIETAGSGAREKIREAITETASLLEGIHFDGPVTETIRQSQEAPDGSGPMGLKGESVLPTARAVHVANAFVALISPRAWREGKTIDAALATMLENIGTRYDRAALAALVTYIESGKGAAELDRCKRDGAA